MSVRAVLLLIAFASCSSTTTGDQMNTSMDLSARDFAGALDSSVLDLKVGDLNGSDLSGATDGSVASHNIQTVFIILMENLSWSDVQASTDAPYINGTILTHGAYLTNYKKPSQLVAPSEPNYIWLEAGDNLSFSTDDDPSSSHHQTTTDHLVTQLNAAGISWKSYQEDITGVVCPLSGINNYAPKHNPMVFFDDVNATGAPSDVSHPLDTMSAYCIAHVRPLTELTSDLASGTTARYNFITPNLCHDMHNSCAPTNNNLRQGDNWLASFIPMIQASSEYAHAAIFVAWDEPDTIGTILNSPIGLMVLSPFAKVGFSSATAYDHSSTLRTMQDIFGVGPYLRAAQTATNLSELFTSFP